MSRYELAELEKELREVQEPTHEVLELADGEEIPDYIKEIPEFIDYQNQLRALIPLRHGTIKRYFERWKYHKRYREDILATAEKSE